MEREYDNAQNRCMAVITAFGENLGNTTHYEGVWQQKSDQGKTVDKMPVRLV
jgi:hypothetical protein